MKKNRLLTNTTFVCLIACICCGLWGSAFPLVKIGYRINGISAEAMNSQIFFGGIRFTLAGLFTILIGSVLAKRVMLPTFQSWPRIMHLSLYQTILQYVFFYIGLSHTTGVKASIVQGTNVFVALLVASLLFHQEKLSIRKWIGCGIGFTGVILVNLNGNGVMTDFTLLGEGFIFLSTVAYAVSSVMLKQYAKEDNTILLSGYQFVIGGLVMTIVGFVMGGRIENFSFSSLGVILYLALVSSVAYTLWGILLKYNPISKVAVFGFMTPILGVMLSAILLHEKQLLGYKSLVALFLVCVGIFIVNRSGEKEL